MAERQLPEPFVHALLACQDTLYAYVMALVMDADKAADIVQEANVVLCREAEQFPTIKNFTAWACKIAYFEILSSRKRQQRDRLVFDDELLSLLAREVPQFVEDVAQWKRLLDICLAELPEALRQLVLKRYGPKVSIQALADELGRSIGSVHQTLHRTRRSLLECIRRKMEGET